MLTQRLGTHDPDLRCPECKTRLQADAQVYILGLKPSKVSLHTWSGGAQDLDINIHHPAAVCSQVCLRKQVEKLIEASPIGPDPSYYAYCGECGEKVPDTDVRSKEHHEIECPSCFSQQVLAGAPKKD